MPDTPDARLDFDGLIHAQSERGTCRVLCFSPRHDLTLAHMDTGSICAVVDAWAAQYEELSALPYVNYVQIFENRGAMMGASNPHPHGQIWATERVPVNPQREQEAQAAYAGSHAGHTLLLDYLALELKDGSRLVCQNDHFVALVPFWAVWPFETIVISREPVGALPDLDAASREGLADILKRLTTRYDNVFHVSFPYSMGFHWHRATGRCTPSGICTRISIRRCSVPPPCASSWWALNCWPRRSAISPPKQPRNASASSPRNITEGFQPR